MPAEKKDIKPLGIGLARLMELASEELDVSGISFELEAIDNETDTEGRGRYDTGHINGQIYKRIDEFFENGVKKLKSGDYVVAAAYFLSIVLIRPDFIKALNNLGICWFYLGRAEEARDAFLKVLEIEPENRTARNNFSKISEKLR